MSDDFEGSASVTLRPGDTNVPIRLRFRPCTATTANDGAIPYGSTVHNKSIRFHEAGSTMSTTGLLGSISMSSNNVIAWLTYTSALAAGLYHMKATITAALNGSTLITMKKGFNLNRIFLKRDN